MQYLQQVPGRSLESSARVVFTTHGLSRLTALLPDAVDGQGAMGNGTLLVAGTTLATSPESRTVPFDMLTMVNIALQGHDAAHVRAARREVHLASYAGTQDALPATGSTHYCPQRSGSSRRG